MKTYREFIEQIYFQLIEDRRASLTQDEIDLLNNLRREKGRTYAGTVRDTILSRSIRNRPSDERANRAIATVSQSNPEVSLRKGEVRSFNRQTQKWESNKP